MRHPQSQSTQHSTASVVDFGASCLVFWLHYDARDVKALEWYEMDIRKKIIIIIIINSITVGKTPYDIREKKARREKHCFVGG